MKILIIPVLLIMASCATSVSLRPEMIHVSHASQHFGSNPTNYGYDEAALDLHLQNGHVIVDISEGAVLEKQSGPDAYGALEGPRETFTAIIGYDIPIKGN